MGPEVDNDHIAMSLDDLAGIERGGGIGGDVGDKTGAVVAVDEHIEAVGEDGHPLGFVEDNDAWGAERHLEVAGIAADDADRVEKLLGDVLVVEEVDLLHIVAAGEQ